MTIIETKEYLDAFIPALERTFGTRVRFCGFQGSRARGEETAVSDIDMVVILDRLTPSDVDTYRSMLAALGQQESSCGFLGGERDLRVWDPADLFWFCLDTTALAGSLDSLRPHASDEVLQQSVWTALCNLFHGCVHNMVHDRSSEILIGLYKSTFFLLRQIEYLRTRTYVARLADLIGCYADPARTLLQIYAELRTRDENLDFESDAETLFVWAQRQLDRGCSDFFLQLEDM